MASHKGLWRVYFGRKADDPYVFSVDDGDTEHKQDFVSVTVHGQGEMRFESSRTPHCWLEIAGEMEFERGKATIWGTAYARQRK